MSNQINRLDEVKLNKTEMIAAVLVHINTEVMDEYLKGEGMNWLAITFIGIMLAGATGYMITR